MGGFICLIVEFLRSSSSRRRGPLGVLQAIDDAVRFPFSIVCPSKFEIPVWPSSPHILVQAISCPRVPFGYDTDVVLHGRILVLSILYHARTHEAVNKRCAAPLDRARIVAQLAMVFADTGR